MAQENEVAKVNGNGKAHKPTKHRYTKVTYQAKRKKVLEAVAQGSSITAAAEKERVSLAAAMSWVKEAREEKTLPTETPKKRSYTKRGIRSNGKVEIEFGTKRIVSHTELPGLLNYMLKQGYTVISSNPVSK